MIPDMLLGAGGDDMIIGALFELLEDVTPDKLSEIIKQNDNHLNDITEGDWEDIRQLVSKINKDKLTPENVIVVLAKKRPDLLYVIWNEPNGHAWAENLYKMFNQKIKATEVVTSHPWKRVITPEPPT